MEETWSDIRTKIGNCTKIYNEKIAYTKDACLIDENDTHFSSKTIDYISLFEDETSDGTTSEACIPSIVDYSICQNSKMTLNEILERQGWSQIGLMKQFHEKKFFLERSKVLQRYAFFRGALYTTDEYFSTPEKANEEIRNDGKCKLFHVCGGLPWQVKKERKIIN